MAENLGPNPTVKGRGVATVRHDKWFARFLNAESRVLDHAGQNQFSLSP